MVKPKPDTSRMLPIILPTCEYLALLRCHEAASRLTDVLEPRRLTQAASDRLHEYLHVLGTYNQVRAEISAIYGPIGGYHQIMDKPRKSNIIAAAEKRETWYAPGFISQTLRDLVAWCAERNLTLSRWRSGDSTAYIRWAIHRGKRMRSFNMQQDIIAVEELNGHENRTIRRANEMLERLKQKAMSQGF